MVVVLMMVVVVMVVVTTLPALRFTSFHLPASCLNAGGGGGGDHIDRYGPPVSVA